MKTSVYLVLKYWKKHKKNAAAVIFSGVLLAAMVFVVLIMQREVYVRGLDNRQNGQGAFDVIIGNSDDEILAKVTEGKTKYTYGYLDVVGELGNAANRFLVGVLHDEYGLYHLPLSEGRLPETSSEIALERTTIEKLYWVGKCGEEITLDSETYTVTGIIEAPGHYYRFGSQNIDYWGYDNHKLPTIFIGDSKNKPLYRVDFLGNYYNDALLPGMEEHAKELDGRKAYEDILKELVYIEGERWVYCNYDYNVESYDLYDVDNSTFLMFIAYIGIAIAILSVFSVMKSVFSERSAWITTLKRIGAGRGAIAKLYIVECAFFTVIQTIIGIAAGCAVYGGIFAYKVIVLGEKPLSGFSSHYIITNNTREPFLYAIICSIAVFVPAYLLCVLVSKPKAKRLRDIKKLRSLSRCFGRVFANGSVTVVQTASLALICFSVIMSYLYFTRTGKEDMRLWLTMPFEVDNYYAGEIDLNENNVAEYYFCAPPITTGIGHQDRPSSQHFMAINPDETKGFDDDTAAKLPAGTVSTGEMGYLFIATEEAVDDYGGEIDLSHEEVQRLFLAISAEKYQNFFDEGEFGSKHLYQAPTRLADGGTISSFTKYVQSGEIVLDAINSGEEILVIYQGRTPPFEVGEKITLYMSEANTDGYGVGNITSAEVTVGAVLQIPQSAPDLTKKAAQYYNDDEREWNFLTTSAGALAMGAPSAAYSEAFTFEEVTGAPFPLSAEASVVSLKELKREIFVNKMKKLGGIALILISMSLLGFSAYFNGIGMKIRAKKYEVSVIRAVGAPVSAIRKRLMLNSLKIPLIASAIAFGLVRISQLVMGKLGAWFMEQMDVRQKLERLQFLDGLSASESQELDAKVNALRDQMTTIRRLFFLDNGMWNPKAEIPMLILFVIICAATFILTALALKKFKRDIAFDLNSGRTRQ